MSTIALLRPLLLALLLCAGPLAWTADAVQDEATALARPLAEAYLAQDAEKVQAAAMAYLPPREAIAKVYPNHTDAAAAIVEELNNQSFKNPKDDLKALKKNKVTAIKSLIVKPYDPYEEGLMLDNQPIAPYYGPGIVFLSVSAEFEPKGKLPLGQWTKVDGKWYVFPASLAVVSKLMKK